MKGGNDQLDFSFGGDALANEQASDNLNSKLFEDAFKSGADRSDFYPNSTRMSQMFNNDLELFDPYNE